MRKSILVALAISVLAITSHAQETPAADVSVGYSYFRIGGSNGTNMNGFSTSAAYNANDWLSMVGDLGVYHASPNSVGVTTTTYMFGPRFSVRNAGKFVPYAQALFGGAHLSAAGGPAVNPFAFSVGGGVAIPVTSSGKVDLRPEFDYIGLRSNGVTTNCVRLAIGLVFHIGQR